VSLTPRLTLCGIALPALLGLLLATGPTASAVTIDWVTVGDPGNTCDSVTYGCFGSVGYAYRIGKYEVTNAQYAEFLNAVAADDPNGLYNENMGSGYGGITRSGSPGSYAYGAIPARANMPVNWVSFYDALRFANWLHNGQPMGAQVSGTTEDGAYLMIAEDYLSVPQVVITRDAGATIFLPTQDEWYKAAYYDAVSTSYFVYPTSSNTAPTAEAPPGTDLVNGSANYNNAVGDLTNVGAYYLPPGNLSASPYGTFDQGGNITELNEAITVFGGTGRRGVRGGDWHSSAYNLGTGAYPGNRPPGSEDEYVGFRVGAVIPEPSTALLLAGGLAGLAAAGRRRSLH
jgi:formylglycine-generating enzyme required for sulfatase activity